MQVYANRRVKKKGVYQQNNYDVTKDNTNTKSLKKLLKKLITYP